MNVTECDTCRALSPIPAFGWIILAVQQPQEPSFAALLGGGGPDIAGTFCRWRCVAEYAVARALITETGQS